MDSLCTNLGTEVSLGLEIEDPNNASVGIPQPILKDYNGYFE